MPDDPVLISDAHATMAVGALGAMLADRRDEITGDVDFPEPPEFLELWHEALRATTDQARTEIIDDRRNRRELARSVADVTEEAEGGREPTPTERAEIEAMAVAHFETYQRLSAKTADWDALPEEQRGLMAAVIADMVRAGVMVPGPATAVDPAARFAVFTEEEQDEIEIAIDHRVAEAEGGNVYVNYDVVKPLEEQITTLRQRGSRPRYTAEELDEMGRTARKDRAGSTDDRKREVAASIAGALDPDGTNHALRGALAEIAPGFDAAEEPAQGGQPA